MRLNKKISLGMILLIGILLSLFFVSAYERTSNAQYSQFSGLGTYTGSSLEMSGCGDDEGRTDFLVQLMPLGCEPAVVRSDLLEEQNVPVFCQLAATKINPLIDVKAIESLSFSGSYPSGIASVGFMPARAALGVDKNLDRPAIMDNIGYAVIVLKKQENASAQPEKITGTLTAKLNYDIENAFGIGKASFYLPVLTDEEWAEEQSHYTFWNGKGFLRLISLSSEGTSGSESASVSVYDGEGNSAGTVSLTRGKDSEGILLPGFDCMASLQLRLDGAELPKTTARLRVGEDTLEIIKGEKFLSDKCTLLSVEKTGLVQKVTVQCKEDTTKGYTQGKAFSLIINPRIVLNSAGTEKTYGTGDIIKTEGTNNLFVGYLGVREKDNKLFMIPVVSSSKDKETFLKSGDATTAKKIGQIIENLQNVDEVLKDNSAIKNVLKSSSTTSNFGEPLYKGDNTAPIYFKTTPDFNYQFEFVGFIGPSDYEFDSSMGTVKQYYDNANEDYDNVINTYPSESGLNEADKKNAKQEALEGKITLAFSLNQMNSLIELCNTYRETYSDVNAPVECKDSYLLASSDISSVFVAVNGKSTRISFEGIEEPSFNKYGASINVFGTGELNNDGENELTIGDKVYLSKNLDLQSGTTTIKVDEFIELKEIKEDSVVLYAEYVDVSTANGKTTQSLKKTSVKLTSDSGVVRIGARNYELGLADINIEKIARVSVIPKIDNTGSEVNFNFTIGIEGRTFELSPGKTKTLIKRMNSTIADIQEKTDKLGSTVKTLRTACVSAGIFFTVKNFFGSTSGQATARDKVMNGAGGWKEKCKGAVAAGSLNGKTISSMNDCYNTFSSEIDADVATATKVLQAQNAQIKEDQEGKTTDEGFFTEGTVDTSAYMGTAIDRVQRDYISKGGVVTNSKGASFNRNEIKDQINYNAWSEDGTFTQEQLRDIEYYERILESNPSADLKATAEDRLYSLYTGVQTSSANLVKQQTLAGSLGFASSDIAFLEVGGNANKIAYTGRTAGEISKLSGLDKSTPVQTILASDGKQYFVALDSSAGLSQIPIARESDGKTLKIYDSSGTLITNNIPPEISNAYFIRQDSVALSNHKIKSPEVKYYNTGANPGLPAIVPFDVNNGWYAATKQTLAVGNNVVSYGKSGRVETFYLCNVMDNGLIEFDSGMGDDSCSFINLAANQPKTIGTLSEQESTRLINKAVDAVEQASDAYGAGVSSVNVGGTSMKVGAPAVNIPEVDCQDTMSPTDCQILFNLCDPVVCPSSRCDLGGTYPVQDVVQSGIFGSLFLCFPNIKEGIYIPVCLSGVKAGLDSYLSVLKSYRDCLQTSLDTGQQVGICDEIYSVHLCEFFWRQALPFAEQLIPKLIAGLTGQPGSRGGGEYLNVKSAWDSASKSADYFTNYYGQNAFEAFKIRSLEQVGGLVCKNQVSGVYPDSADLFDQLTEPESPPQYTARFDEIPMTTTTNPPLSQYKVFYHIYAGDGKGAYFSVYLKPMDGGSFYQDVGFSRVVAQGFIPPGEYKSETADFSAPTGYKKLCVNVNGQEECDFKEVSTSFAIDYLSDKKRADYASQSSITQESDCISGSLSIYSMVNPSIEGAVQEMANPSIYDQGIIRTCATENPGKGTDPYINSNKSRWMDVGYCGQQQLRCWLDTKSVKDNIQGSGVASDVINAQSESTLQGITQGNENQYINDFDSAFKKIKAAGTTQTAFDSIAETLTKVYMNSQKAKLLLHRANLYSTLAQTEFKIVNDLKKKAEEAAANNPLTSDTVPVSRTAREVAIAFSDKSPSDASPIFSALNVVTYTIYLMDVQDDPSLHYDVLLFSLASGKKIAHVKISVFTGEIASYYDLQKNVIIPVNSLNSDFKELIEDAAIKNKATWNAKLMQSGIAVGNVEEVPVSQDSPQLSSLVFTFEDGLALNPNLFYRYVSGWQWSPKEGEWYEYTVLTSRSGDALTDTNQQFISNMEGGFDSGVAKLIQRTLSNSEGRISDARLVTDNVIFDVDGVFTVEQAQGTSPIYFKFAGSSWKWSSNRNTWDDLNTLPNTPVMLGIKSGLDLEENKDVNSGGVVMFKVGNGFAA